jgi:hypothetical protein
VTYGYRCECGYVFDYTCSYDDRRTPKECDECGGEAQYSQADSLTRHFHGFVSYYDEGLDCDIHGSRHRREVMRSQNVIEAGDAKGGARTVEKTAIGQQPVKGISHSDNQYKAERNELARQKQVVSFRNSDGTERVTRHQDNSSDTKKAFKLRHNFKKGE